MEDLACQDAFRERPKLTDFCLNVAEQVAARAERAQEEAAQLTFRPAINAHGPAPSRPPLRLSDPSPYLVHEHGLAVQRQRKAAELARQAEVHACMRPTLSSM